MGAQDQPMTLAIVLRMMAQSGAFLGEPQSGKRVVYKMQSRRPVGQVILDALEMGKIKERGVWSLELG